MDYCNDDTYLDIDLYNSSDYTNMIVYSDGKSLDTIITESNNERSPKLTLEKIQIGILPTSMIQMDWICELTMDNVGLTNIEYLPCNIINLTIENNNIQILNGNFLPQTLKEFTFNNNNTCEIINLNEGLETIEICNNIMSEMCDVPISTISLDLSDNKLLNILPNLQNNLNLTNLIIDNTDINNIDLLSNTIENLETCKCNIPTVRKLPKNLLIWVRSNIFLGTLKRSLTF